MKVEHSFIPAKATEQKFLLAVPPLSTEHSTLAVEEEKALHKLPGAFVGFSAEQNCFFSAAMTEQAKLELGIVVTALHNENAPGAGIAGCKVEQMLRRAPEAEQTAALPDVPTNAEQLAPDSQCAEQRFAAAPPDRVEQLGGLPGSEVSTEQTVSVCGNTEDGRSGPPDGGSVGGRTVSPADTKFVFAPGAGCQLARTVLEIVEEPRIASAIAAAARAVHREPEVIDTTSKWG